MPSSLQARITSIVYSVAADIAREKRSHWHVGFLQDKVVHDTHELFSKRTTDNLAVEVANNLCQKELHALVELLNTMLKLP